MALPAAASNPGDLDTTFGAGGKVTTDFGGNDIANAVATQSDGKLVAVGVYFPTPSAGDFAVARYNIDGSLDTAFGIGGKVTTSFGSAGRDQAWAVAIYKSGPNLGKIVVVGDTTASGPNRFALARYNTDGSLDTSFDTDGMVTTDFRTSPSDISPMAQAFSVALQSDDKIVLSGAFFKFFSNGWDFALARYNADGSLDTSFGGTGKVITNVGGFPFGSGDSAASVAIQSDGKILAAGSANPLAQNNSDFALVRYNTDGSLDTSFGTGGKVTTELGSTADFGKSVAIQSDGKIVLAGQYGDYPSADFALARYNTDGSLDASFDTDGKVLTNFGGWDLGQSVAIQSDGGIVAAGHTQNASFALDFALARYNADGSLDSSFGIGGKVTTDFGGGPDAGHSVAIQSDGKIVAAGSGGNGDFALARYGGTPPVVIDDEPPVIVCPTGIAVECDGTGNLAARTAWINSFTAADNSGSVTLTVSPAGIVEACGDTRSESLVFTATDPEGNSTSCTSAFTIVDTAPPVLAGAPSNITVEYDAVPFPSTVTATDLCDPDSVVTFAEIRTNGDCAGNYTLTRTWTAKDACGNSSTASQIVTVRDSQPPVILQTASGETVECDGLGNTSALNAWLASQAGAEAMDGSGTVAWTHDFTALELSGCGATGAVTVTFTATDNCGNSNSTSATFTIIDTASPTLVWKINGVAVDFFEVQSITPNQVPVTVTVSATDVCGETFLLPLKVTSHMINPSGKIVDKSKSSVIEITGGTVTIVDSGGVGNIITLYASAIDECGNLSTEEVLVIQVNKPTSGGTGGGSNANDGVGNGVDGNTPGHDHNGGNDDPEFGPGNPGAKNK